MFFNMKNQAKTELPDFCKVGQITAQGTVKLSESESYGNPEDLRTPWGFADPN